MKTLYQSILFFGMLLNGLATLAQTTLSGSVRTPDQKPLPFVSIALLNARDSTLVKGAISKETGTYEFENVRPGQYRLAASAVGYAPTRTGPVQVGTSPVTLPALILRETTGTLGEVTVTAKKPMYEQQVDRLVVNVQNSITAAGGNALEVLERSPGITVNRQNNSLTMSGKGGVLVMMDGKLTRLPIATVVQMLEGMSANDIEKIELITTPPARYDAEGDAGIINIITKKNTSFGTNGNFSLTYGQGRQERPAATLNLNHRSRKLNLYSNYSFTRLHGWNQFAFGRTIQQTDGPLATDLVQNRYFSRNTHTAKVGFDYTLSPQTTLSGQVAGFDNLFGMESPTATTIALNEVLTKQNLQTTLETNHWQHLLLNLNLRHVFKNKAGRGPQEWSLDIDRLYYGNSNPTQYVSELNTVSTGSREQQQFRVSKQTPIQLWVLKTDFIKPLTKGRFEAGLKATTTRLDNAVELNRMSAEGWKLDSVYTNRYKLAENILAGYVSLNRPLDAKTTLQAGLRYEYTQTDINTPAGKSLVHRQYGNLFPSVFVSRKLSKNHTVNLSYSRRITRPSYDDIAPFVIFYDPNTYGSGNPALLPTISDAVQGSYTFKEAYVFSLKYSYDRNVIAGFQPHVDVATNRLLYYAENIDHQQTLSLVMSLPWQITPWWKSQNSLTGLWQNITTVYQDSPVDRTAWSALLNSSHTFTLPRKFTAELTGFYISPGIWGVYQNKSYGTITLGLQKTLPADKGTLRLAVSDVFWTGISRWTSTIPALNLAERGRYVIEPRIVRLTYTRSFGSKTVKSAKSRATGSEEERTRLQSN